MLALDHIVIAAENPEQAANSFSEKHGLSVIKGGKHHNWGTYNYLAYLANDSYIEWLGIFDEQKALQSENPLVSQLVEKRKQTIEGPIQYALRTSDMDSYVRHFQHSQIAFTGPIPGSRKRPDGSLLEWRMLFPKSNASELPFLIEWGAVKNTPKDSDLVNPQKIDVITDTIKNADEFADVFQVSFDGNTARLENARWKKENNSQLNFSIT